MSWTQTLQLAQTLTKAIQANAKREATATPEPQTQETPMGDDALTPTDPQAPDADAAAPAPTPEPVPVNPAVAAVAQAAAPDATAMSATSDAILPPDINETLKNAASLAQALHQNPEVLRFMHVLLGKFGATLDKDV